MSYDSLMLRRIVAEINELRGSRVRRVFPSARQEFVLEMAIRTPLPQIVINVSAEWGRAHREHNLQPALEADTPLGSVLRRHLRGAVFLQARQQQFDRVLYLDFVNAERLGLSARRTLVAEIMGHRSNLALLDEQGRILECARHVPAHLNRVRQLMPGELYIPVPDFGKLDPASLTADQLAALMPSQPQPLTEWLRQTLQGMSDILMEILLWRLELAPHALTTDTSAEAIWQMLRELWAQAEQLGPAYYAIKDFTRHVAYPVPLPPDYHILEKCSSLSQACRQLYRQRMSETQQEQLRAHLISVLRQALEKAQRKQQERQKALEKATEAEMWRRKAELLTAHLWAIPPGQKQCVVQDWETGEDVVIALDPRLSPAQNAQHFFARYKKLQRVREHVPNLLEQARREQQEIEDWLDQAEQGSLPELRLLEQELTQRGLIKPPRRRPSLIKANYRRAETLEGYVLLYGRNALENAAVLKAARPDDLWFHVQGAPGGHVVLRTDNRPEAVPQSALLAAARLAAQQSQRRREASVPVDYTLVKHLQRPKHAPPGYVLYRQFKTIYVKP